MKQASYHCVKDSTRNVIYPIYEEKKICDHLIEALGYDLNEVIDKSFGKITKIHMLGRMNFQELIVLGMGSMEDMTSSKMREVFTKVSKVIDSPASFAAKRAVCENIDLQKVSELFVETYLTTVYEETKHGEKSKIYPDVDIMAKEDVSFAIEKALVYAEGINHAKDMANTPANFMTPKQLAKEAKDIADAFSLEYLVFKEKELEEMNAGGILSVSAGSDEEAYLICLKYEGKKGAPYTALVGKGITFDSGGYNIKPNSYGMKYDMCGAANVLATIEILASLKAECNVYAIVPAAENLINGHAYKPQDVISMMSGSTVEIVSTDAEGRLLLADGITYAQTLPEVEYIIDVATLTGACVVALGEIYTGVFANDDDFYSLFDNALKESDEKGWRMPIDEAYGEMLKSNSADLKNSSGKRGGGASVAASFLNHFVKKGVKWIHLDVAGSASKDDIGATGTMIRSMCAVVEKIS